MLDGVVIKRLAAEEVATVIKHWKYAGHNSNEDVKQGALKIHSAGLHLHGKLISWAYVSVDGGIHAVYTMEEFRGKGYGKLTVKYLCKEMAVNGLIPLVHVETENAVSRSMMEGIGFKYSHSMDWIIFDASE